MILKTIYEVKENALNTFSCGNGDLDGFLKKYAKINDENGYGKTFLLMDEKRIVGFFTLCSSSIRFEEFPEFNSHLFPKYPIPCIKIARLAVDIDYQGKETKILSEINCGDYIEILKKIFERENNIVYQIYPVIKKDRVSYNIAYSYRPEKTYRK